MRPLDQLKGHLRTKGKGSKPREGSEATYDIFVGGGRFARGRTISVQVGVIRGWTRLRITVKEARYTRSPDIYEVSRVRQLFFFPEEIVIQCVEEPNSDDFVDIWEKTENHLTPSSQ
jgi:hypothetical protein